MPGRDGGDGAEIFAKYDLSADHVESAIEIPTRPPEGVVIVVGASGSGKSTILRSWGMVETVLDRDVPIWTLFESGLDAEHWLTVAGLRSIPTWRRTLNTVSNGECHRAEVAVALSRGSEFIDEFTSLVDRQTARALCHSINRAGLSNLVVATCHVDVCEYLRADHIYDVDAGEWLDASARRCLRRWHEPLSLKIRPCDAQAVWPSFSRHHYLDSAINKSANAWTALMDGKAVAFLAVIAMPHRNIKNGWRGHRLVVLPEYQGMGIGNAFHDAVAGLIVESGCRYFSKAANVAVSMHHENSIFWRPTSKNRKLRTDYKSERGAESKETTAHMLKHAERVCTSHEFVIPSDEEFEEYMLTIGVDKT